MPPSEVRMNTRIVRIYPARIYLYPCALNPRRHPLFAQSTTDLKWAQLPPELMVKLIDAAPTPTISLSPPHTAGPRRILIQQSSSLPTIADLAEPELRLAGLRFNPKVGAPSRTRYFVSLKLQELPTSGEKGPETAITGLPAKPHVLYTQWSPDGRHIAFVNQEPTGLTLWTVDVARAHAAPIPGVRVNAVLSTQILHPRPASPNPHPFPG